MRSSRGNSSCSHNLAGHDSSPIGRKSSMTSFLRVAPCLRRATARMWPHWCGTALNTKRRHMSAKSTDCQVWQSALSAALGIRSWPTPDHAFNLLCACSSSSSLNGTLRWSLPAGIASAAAAKLATSALPKFLIESADGTGDAQPCVKCAIASWLGV